MALFNRPSSSSSLKSEKSAANTKKNVRFSDQPPEVSLEKKEPLTGSAQCNNPEAEKKSSVSVENPKSEPFKPMDVLRNHQSSFESLWNTCTEDMQRCDELDAYLHEQLVGLTYEELLDFQKKVERYGYLQLNDPRMEPLRLGSSSTETRSQTGLPITSQRRSVRSSIGIGAAPPPRFVNPAKITKSKDEERGTASYLNQQQLYMLRQQETRVIRKLETKSIPQLQMLQHKALTTHASNKIKNLIQRILFEKHMAEMKEWEGQVDVWSKDG
ncbi:hypothetical protein KCU65_g7424, partial [Aureobasidium melanogenum]